MHEMGTEHWLLLAGAVWFGVRLLIFARNVLRAAARSGEANEVRPRHLYDLALFSSLVGAAVAYSAVIALWPDLGLFTRTALALLAAVVGLLVGAMYDLSLSLREWRLVAWLLARRLPFHRQQLRSPDAAQRLLAARSICLMYQRAAPAIPDLIASALNDTSTDVRTWSAIALLFSDADQPEIVPTARALLADPVPALRSVAAALLVQKNASVPEEVVDQLGEGLTHPDENIATMAGYWLSKLGAQAAPAHDAMHSALFDREPPNDSVLDVLAGMGEAGVPMLIDALKHPNFRVRRHAAWTLGQMGEAARYAVDPLQDLQGDDDESVRRVAVEALTRILKSLPPTDGAN